LSTSAITGYIIEDKDGNPLAPYQLSSGERQLFLIFAYLIDRVGFQKYSNFTPKLPPLVLIDEPEVSLHISWQRAFIDDLADVFNVEGEPSPQFIIATHSPAIVSTHMYRGHELGVQGVVEDLEM
jgi:predicted ATP-dependent endonuclease of OLD family